jgi:hypothetical protein
VRTAVIVKAPYLVCSAYQQKRSFSMRTLKHFLLFTDIGFLLYWSLTLLHLFPEEYLFKDYNNPILFAWNLSFLPLDLIISFTGILSLLLHKKHLKYWNKVVLISLVLTSCSGLQAISFWTLRRDFDLMWWLPNLFLLIYPLFFIRRLLSSQAVD